MDLDLDNRAALVAASSRGLRRAIATELAAEGTRGMSSARDEVALRETTRKVGEVTGAEVDHYAADLARAEEVQKCSLCKTTKS